MLESLYEPEPSIIELLNHRESAERFAELKFQKVLLFSSIDFDFLFHLSLCPSGKSNLMFALKHIIGVLQYGR